MQLYLKWESKMNLETKETIDGLYKKRRKLEHKIFTEKTYAQKDLSELNEVYNQLDKIS